MSLFPFCDEIYIYTVKLQWYVDFFSVVFYIQSYFKIAQTFSYASIGVFQSRDWKKKKTNLLLRSTYMIITYMMSMLSVDKR